jgi:hypothetical protein
MGEWRAMRRRAKTARHLDRERWAEYAQRKNAWIEKHPNVDPREIEAAVRKILTELGL